MGRTLGYASTTEYPKLSCLLIWVVGDIVSVTLLGQPMVILNSPKLAVEMLERKSSIYSDRPTFTMGGKLVGWDRTLVLLHYGSRFREYRRLFSQLIGSRKMVASYAQHMEAETSRFLARLLRQPDQLAKQVRKFVSLTLTSFLRSCVDVDVVGLLAELS